ncbi:hypothetical protein CS063_16640 [Sporanaerobium hydrogeniformans]|uniref:Uncharacterized protein n=1 Tax=Sporanaerobium hydrogeniformans TaxID=3072179 RepID=A0AC61D7I7_9FIRM|nr:hypothetical protein [Sporanaerobium hydrogeniformans]PHV69282.1 hypothetical protein CS063_16640 [Sporanaerobium hydrogeniformans]
MIIGLFSIQCVLALIIVLTTKMILHKFEMIETSIELYNNSRVYKTQSSIAFIDSIIRKYDEIENKLKDKVDIETFLVTTLHKEKIGSFSYLAIKNLATKTIFLMWAVIMLEILVISIDRLAFTGPMIILTSVSGLLAIGSEVFTIVMGVVEKQELILTLMTNYLINIFPVENEERNKKRMNGQIRRNDRELLQQSLREEDVSEKVQTLKDQPISFGKEKNNKLTKNGQDKKAGGALTAQDIAKLIKILQ